VDRQGEWVVLLLRAVAVGPPPLLEIVPVSGLESLTLWTT